MKKNFLAKGALPALAMSALSVAISATAQENNDGYTFKPVLEEVVVVGRLKSTAENLVIERLEQEVAVDFLSSEAIGRVGDSTVAAALRRVPGITLIDDKYVFVRGLGERYSSTLLNGAVVPSPDLSRSVIPLDIFPTSIVQSLAVQKVHSADMPAAFGGGSVDIRTKGIPDGLVFSVELGSSVHSESDGDFLSYEGGDEYSGEDDGTRRLSSAISEALYTYRGSLDSSDILEELRKTNPNASSADAQAINRQLATELNRKINVAEKNGSQDFSAELNVGNRFYLGEYEETEVGFLLGYSYGSTWRNKNSISRAVNNDEEVDVKRQSVHNIAMAANMGLGFRLNEDHSIETMSLFLRDTDDKTSIVDGYDENKPYSTREASDREYRLRFEQREMQVHQIHGKHSYGEASQSMLDLPWLDFLVGSKFNWFYSDSESTTDIPNEVTVETAYVVGPPSRSIVAADNSAADYRFTDLQDEVESHGWEVKIPYSSMDWKIDVSGGSEYWQKVRRYRQSQFGLGSVEASTALRSGALNDVFSDANILNPDNGYGIDVIGSNSESYIAANRVDAYYGKLDVTWQDTWRVVAGVRYEDYQQVGLTWDPLDFTGSPVLTSENQGPEAVAAEISDAVYTDDDTFFSMAATYMRPGFFAEDFQLRMSYSETTVRPDLREIAASSYVDPISGALVFGNPDVVPAQFKNYDLRGEWFFDNGDNLTASLFYKDITDPIETFQAAGLDTTTAVEIINAESATILGAEVEFMKDLGDYHESLYPFFLQGNLTVLETELIAGNKADAPTNAKRDLVGASDYVINFILGFDSPDELHSATLSYNVFGERLYFAGRNGEPDAYEQPFHSVDATYSFYPTDAIILKLKLKNILDESLEIQREVSGRTVTTYEEDRGRSISASLKYEF